MTYYVEPDYWIAGYADGDSSGTIVYGSGLSSATGLSLAGSNYSVGSQRGILTGYSTLNSAGDLIAIFPGISLRANSTVSAAGGSTRVNSGLVSALSSTKVGGRIFWETTSPSSGVWTEIVPQAEGSGE